MFVFVFMYELDFLDCISDCSTIVVFDGFYFFIVYGFMFSD